MTEENSANDKALIEFLSEEVATLKKQVENLEIAAGHYRNLYNMALEEVAALKRSESYRIGNLMLKPARVALRVAKPLARKVRAKLRPVLPGGGAAAAGGGGPEMIAGGRVRWMADWRAEMQRRQPEFEADLARLPEGRPSFSILIPVYNTEPAMLRECLDSALAMIYDRFEVCVMDDGSPKEATQQVLEEYRARGDARLKIARQENAGISAALNGAAAMATGEFLCFLDHDDVVAPNALVEFAARALANAKADLIHSDEDNWRADGALITPFYKPDFSPELMLSYNYICHFTAVRAEIFRELGGFRSECDGSQDFDLFLRVIEKARAVEHVPQVLYHWRITAGSVSNPGTQGVSPCRGASMKALADAVERRGQRATIEDGMPEGTFRVRFEVKDPAPISILIPTKDRIELLRLCIESIHGVTQYAGKIDILVVSNSSEKPETYQYLVDAQKRGELRFVRHDAPFNYSELNNVAAANSDSPYLLFLNNDVEVETPEWLTAMVEYMQQPAIGAVGAKLIYPNRTVQHAGIFTGHHGVAGVYHRYMPETSHGYFGYASVVRDVTGVTGACLMTRRDVFDQVGRFDEQLPVAFNDVDLCLRIRAAGYRVVYQPFARLLHRESISRGVEDTPEKIARFNYEIAFMKARWGETLFRDPYYSPNLTLCREDVSEKSAADREDEKRFIVNFDSARKQAKAEMGLLAGANRTSAQKV